jgi:hypothetical protein
LTTNEFCSIFYLLFFIKQFKQFVFCTSTSLTIEKGGNMVSGTTTPPPIRISGGVPPNLAPMPVPPLTLLRIIPGSKWARFVWPYWLKHVASRASGGAVQAPFLGKVSATHIYVTDEPSLHDYLDPASIARRLGLQPSAHTDCDRYGAVIIRFRIADPGVAILPPPSPLASQQGLTSGDAREWMVPNVLLDAAMDVIYIGISPRGNPFWYFVPLTT